MADSFLDAAAVASIQDAVHRGFATVLGIQEPRIWLELHGIANDGSEMGVPAHEVVVKFGGQSPRESNQPSSEQTLTEGTLRAVAPWGVQKDMTFTLPGGERGVIIAVPPLRYGIQRAVFRLIE